MSRSTKILVIGSNLIALWLIATLVSRGIPSIFAPTVTAFVVSLLAAVVLGDVATGIVLSTIYLVPAACFIRFNSFVFSYYAIWLAALCGAMLPRAVGTPWAYPRPFTVPLVLWGLVLALSWPVVLLREVDFVPAMLSQAGPRATLPQPAADIAVWIASVAAIALTGLLLLDWLFILYQGDRSRRFERHVIWPMFGGAAFAAVVAAYQALVNISFLNHTAFESYGRVVGTMRDANPFGVAMALWLPCAFAMMVRTAGRRYVAAAWAVACVFLGIAVWASGSRTALLAALIGLFVVIARAWRSFTVRQSLRAVVGAMILCAAVAWFVPSTTMSRARFIVPSLSRSDLQFAAYQLWARDMYGTVAMRMVAEHPLVGVGIGGFHFQFGDLLYRINRTGRPPDNAQNWYRQQLAEFGVLGSLGWIAWTLMFVWMLARRPDADKRSAIAGAVKGAILGLAAASLLGIPTQDTAASITFVVFACWCMRLKGFPQVGATEGFSRISNREWAAILIVLACFLGGTVYAGKTELRPPLRAYRIGFPYRYGFFADRTDPTIRWAGAKAVEVFSSDKRWLKLVIGDVAPDAEQSPVHVTVSINREVILDVNRRSSFPITRWVKMPAVYGTPMMMEIDVDRTWRPSDVDAAAEPQERGVAIREWSFQDRNPPKGSITFENPPAAIN